MSSWSPVWTTAAFSALQGVVVYALFECWRRQESKRGVYQPRQYARPHRTPEEPSGAPLGWIPAVMKVRDDETLRMVGMDHYVMLRFLKFGMRLTLGPTILAAVVIIFVYYNGGNGLEEFSRLTMANVRAESIRLWWSTILMYVVVLWGLLLLWREWANFVPKRFKFLAEGDPDMDREVQYTVMVENIPKDKQSSPALYAYFDHLFPGKVSYASLCMESGELELTLSEKQQALEKVEHAVAQKHLHPDKDHTTKVGGVCCCGGEKVNTENHYRREMQRLLGEADKEHSRISQLASEGAGTSVASSTGFVAFTSCATKLSAAELNLSGKALEMDAFVAPAPKDVIWSNVTCPAPQVAAKKTIANCLWILGIMTWAIPVTFVQAIADLDALSEQFSWLWTPDPGSFLYGIIAGLLPVVALAILTALVPIVIELVAVKFVKMKSESDVSLYVFKWHFGFRVANLWLIIISGSLLDKLPEFIDDPASIVDLLGESVPGKANFFMQMVLVALLSGLPMDLSQVIRVVIKMATGMFGDDKGKSDRELRRAKTPPSLNWGKFYPPLLFFVLVAFTYCAIAPLLVPTCFLLFYFSFLVQKNQSLYVYVQTAESGGAFMYLLFTFTMACLYVSEIIFVAFIGIKKGAGQGTAAIVLVVITALWHMVINKHYVKMSKTQCIEAAVDADYKSMKETGQGSSGEHPFDGKAYVQACLKKSEWETKPEGYRDASNDKKDASQGDRHHNPLQVEDATAA